jgi:hypothetical protein
MPAPAVQAAIEAVLAKVEAIVPTIDPSATFRRRGETAPGTTKAGKRWFDLQAAGHPRDLSNEGAGVQAPGLADRIASVTLLVDYPVGRSEKALEMTMMVDSELLLRALGRSANWAGTPVRRVVARTTIERDILEPTTGQGLNLIRLTVTAEIQYRDTEL